VLFAVTVTSVLVQAALSNCSLKVRRLVRASEIPVVEVRRLSMARRPIAVVVRPVGLDRRAVHQLVCPSR